MKDEIDDIIDDAEKVLEDSDATVLKIISDTGKLGLDKLQQDLIKLYQEHHKPNSKKKAN